MAEKLRLAAPAALALPADDIDGRRRWERRCRTLGSKIDAHNRRKRRTGNELQTICHLLGRICRALENTENVQREAVSIRRRFTNFTNDVESY